MRVAVKVLPKKEILDTQGRAVLEVLRRDFDGIQNCQVGKWIILEFSDISKDEALKRAQEWAKGLLSNPLIEDFELEVL